MYIFEKIDTPYKNALIISLHAFSKQGETVKNYERYLCNHSTLSSDEITLVTHNLYFRQTLSNLLKIETLLQSKSKLDNLEAVVTIKTLEETFDLVFNRNNFLGFSWDEPTDELSRIRNKLADKLLALLRTSIANHKQAISLISAIFECEFEEENYSLTRAIQDLSLKFCSNIALRRMYFNTLSNSKNVMQKLSKCDDVFVLKNDKETQVMRKTIRRKYA